MKQHITIKQLDELSDIEKVSLRYSLTRGTKWQEYIWDDIVKMLTIGKMIEMLSVNFNIESLFLDTDVNIVTLYGGNGATHFEEEALVDALWEAIKEIL